MSKAIERKRAIRSANRGVLTKYMKEAIEHMSGEMDQSKLDRLTTLNKLLNEKLALLIKLDSEILEECDIKDIGKDIEESEEIKSRVYETKNKIEQLFVKKQQVKTSNESPVSVSTEITTESVIEHSSPETNPVSMPMAQFVQKTRLPKLSLPRFNGEITKFRTFWDSFQSAVDNNPNLTPIDKFNYLYSLLEGPGLHAIQGLTITEDNYKSAVEILHLQFGRTQQVVAAHMDELLKLPTCSGSKASSLRSIYDKVSVNVRGLEAVGVKADQYGSLLIPVIMSKLPEEVRIQIARNTSKDVWEIGELLNVIQKEVEAREVCENIPINASNLNKKHNGPGARDLGSAKALMASESGLKNKFPIRCAFCQKPHYSASCEEVRDVSKRKEILKLDNRCFVCLLKGHIMKQCDKKCRRCQGLHHQSISKAHDPPKESQTKQDNSKGSDKKDPEGHTVATSTVSQLSRSSTRKREVLLQTATMFAFSHDDSELVPVRILLDSGSQRSYVTDQLKEKLGLNSLGTETLNLNTFGDDRVTKQRCDKVKIKLQAKPETVEISALTFSKICSPLSMKLDVESYPHLRGLQLADSSLVNDIPTNIDILIGSDHYFDVVTDEICRGDKGPVAINTILGWVISGPTQKDIKDDASSANLIILRGNSDPAKSRFAFEDKNQTLTNELRRFWDTESLGIYYEKTDDDKFLKELTYHDDEKRYEVSLPWKPESQPESNGYASCANRLRQLHRCLKKDKELLQEYDKIIQQQVVSGIIEPVSEEQDTDEGTYYLPHHGVVRQDKETTKSRVVFDGSGKPDNSNVSINDCLEKGPNLVPDLFDVIINFRGYAIGMIADIEKAFHQVKIAPDDRRMVRFLWFDDPNKERPEIRKYQFCRLVFGIVSSPAILTSVLNHHLAVNEEKNPEIVSLLRKSFYVDDFAIVKQLKFTRDHKA